MKAIKDLGFDKRKRKKYIQDPVRPVKVNPSASVSDLLKRMGDTAFQGKNLSKAVDIWEDMIKGETLIFFGLAGAMVPAGMREVIVHLIENRYIDVLVSTGANLFHDIHETLGWDHFQGSATASDIDLREAGVDRMYDVYAVDEEFNASDKYIYEFAACLEKRPYTTREFFKVMGDDLRKVSRTRTGIVSAASKAGVPIYCPAPGDSSIGIAISCIDGTESFLFDIIGDVKETAHLASKAKNSGIIFIGGGTPKNFIQQTEVTAAMMNKRAPGHKYAIQITADSPHWGGLSGCTFEEAQSWGKIAKKSSRITVNCDSTIALPLISTALSQRLNQKLVKKRKLPVIDFTGSGRVKSRQWE